MDDKFKDLATRVGIYAEADVAVARQFARAIAVHQGLSRARVEALATAVSELARNIIVHAGGGEILVGSLEQGTRRGVQVVARDDGPGISDIEQALRDGFSTGNGLGLGLPSVRRLVDDFELVSTVAAGTTVRLRQWA